MGYKIGSFNVKKLSFATVDEKDEDRQSATRNYGAISTIIRENFDIVALQEVMNENILKIIFPSILGWEYRWMQSRSKSDDSNEGYAFAWNTKKIRLTSEPDLWIQYKRDPILGQAGLLRHPFYGRFTPSGTLCGGPFFEFRLINTHIRFKPSANKSLAATDAQLRQQEFLILTEQILNRIEDKRYGNYMPAYTILLGDYNLNLKSPNNKPPYVEEFVYIDDPQHKKMFVTVQDKPTTLSSHKQTDQQDTDMPIDYDGFANNYDHFTYNKTYFDSIGIKADADVIDSVKLYCGNDFKKHFQTISDHIPIVLDVNLK